MAEEKTKQILINYINHAQKYIADHKKDFSSWNTIKHKFIKKDKIDPSYEYTKEIIKRMERDRMQSQTAMQIAESLMPEMQNIKKEIIIMAVPMILGFILAVTFLILLCFTKPFNFSNMFVVYYLIGLFIGSILFGFGMIKRKDIKVKTLSKTMLFQASSAYAAAKMQGQGSFGAYRILEEMKTKQGKEMQIRINQPKIIHK